MTALLPSIVPTQPDVVQNTQSRYFDNRVDWCEAMLGDRAWSRHSAIPKTDICNMIGQAVSDEISQLTELVSRKVDGSRNVTPDKCSQGEYHVDAAIALLDIGLLVMKRQERFRKTGDHPAKCQCLCVPCVDCEDRETTCTVDGVFAELLDALVTVEPDMEKQEGQNRVIGTNEVEDDESDDLRDKDTDTHNSNCELDQELWEWIGATFCACSDGTPHDLRLAILKYVDLPPLLPNLSVIDDQLEDSLRRCINNINEIIKSEKMPRPTGEPVKQIHRDVIVLDVNGRPLPGAD
jgi:hypothetical protein